jgi:cell division protein FtsB
MRDFRKQRRGSSGALGFVGLLIGLLILLTLAVFAVQAAWGMYVKFSAASRADDAARLELAELKTRYNKVEAAVANLHSGRGEEGEIRSRFGVARPGEGTIQIVRENTTTDAEQNLNQENPFFRLLRALFVW